MYTNEAIAGLIPNNKNEVLDDYLFYLFNAKLIDLENVGLNTFGKSLNSGYLKSEVKIPLPPLDIQKQIINSCEVLSIEEAKAEAEIEKARESIIKINNDLYSSNFLTKSIESLSVNIQYGINDSMNTQNKGYKIFRMNEIIHGYMDDNGNMKYVDISKEEFEKYKLAKGDILFNRTNSIEHVGKTGLFNLDGDYCYASYLIRIEINREKAMPEYVNYLMNSDQFQTYAKSQASKSIRQTLTQQK